MKKNRTQHSRAEKISLCEAIVLLVVVVLLTVAITSFVYVSYKVVYIKRYPMLLKVVDEKLIGLAVPVNETITFGKVPRGGSSIVKINIKNSEHIPLIAQITMKGNISDWINVSDNNFVLKGDEEREVKIIASVPKDAVVGNYAGMLYVVLKRYK